MRSSITPVSGATQHRQSTRASGSGAAWSCARGYHDGEQMQGGLIAGDATALSAVEDCEQSAGTGG
eukprot:7045889-Alexandrium_andersonii.AAC.1